MNKKGFTLVEVIACMAILGILAAISYPAILNMVASHKKQQYEEYEKLMVNAAKIYFDEKPINSSGCYYVKLSTLKQQGLIQSISLNKLEANYSNSMVVFMNKKYIPILDIKRVNSDESVYRTKDVPNLTFIYTGCSGEYQ